MTWIIGGVSLSYGPARVRLPKSAKKSSLKMTATTQQTLTMVCSSKPKRPYGTIPVADTPKYQIYSRSLAQKSLFQALQAGFGWNLEP